MISQSIVGYSQNRAEDDFYPTPPQVTRDILKRESFTGRIWEPACGDGSMANVLLDTGLPVIATDLVYRGYGERTSINFLLENRTVENIVTNPPFSLITEFAYHAMKCTTNKVVFLAKLAFLETVERKALFEQTPLARVWVYSKRIRMDKGFVSSKSGGGMIAFAWFVWEHGYKDEPVIRWI